MGAHSEPAKNVRLHLEPPSYRLFIWFVEGRFTGTEFGRIELVTNSVFDDIDEVSHFDADIVCHL